MGLDGTRILVADDDPELLDWVVGWLRREGAAVLDAASGDQLLDRLAYEGPFDLIITDVSMPWMSGLHVMQSARTAGVGTPIIVMTGVRDDRIPAQVEALGRQAAYLRKPFDMSQLESVAERLLAAEG
jgi:CheY-like chemotaxis protein